MSLLVDHASTSDQICFGRLDGRDCVSSIAASSKACTSIQEDCATAIDHHRRARSMVANVICLSIDGPHDVECKQTLNERKPKKYQVS